MYRGGGGTGLGIVPNKYQFFYLWFLDPLSVPQGSLSRKNTLSFGHCPNWGGPQIDFDTKSEKVAHWCAGGDPPAHIDFHAFSKVKKLPILRAGGGQFGQLAKEMVFSSEKAFQTSLVQK